MLMYSRKNDTLMTRSEIAMLPTPAPMGTRHHPYAFADYIGDVTDALDAEGYVIHDEEYAVTKDNNRMFGMMQIGAKEGELIRADDWKITVGLRGSHDQRIPRGLVIGTQVTVCSNLCFHGNITNMKTKQTTNIETRLPELLRKSVAQIHNLAEYQEEVFDRWRNSNLRPGHGDQVLVDLYRNGAFSSPQLTRAIDEWHEPSHAEHAEQDWSLWRLFNASTEAVKPTGDSTNMHLVHDRTRKISDWLETMVA